LIETLRETSIAWDEFLRTDIRYFAPTPHHTYRNHLVNINANFSRLRVKLAALESLKRRLIEVYRGEVSVFPLSEDTQRKACI